MIEVNDPRFGEVAILDDDDKVDDERDRVLTTEQRRRVRAVQLARYVIGARPPFTNNSSAYYAHGSAVARLAQFILAGDDTYDSERGMTEDTVESLRARLDELADDE